MLQYGFYVIDLTLRFKYLVLIQSQLLGLFRQSSVALHSGKAQEAAIGVGFALCSFCEQCKKNKQLKRASMGKRRDRTDRC